MNMNQLATSAGQEGKKSFWKRPEGITGLITLLGMGVGAIVALNVFGPAILAALALAVAITTKGIVLGALVCAAILLYLVATSKKVHLLVEVGFKMVMRTITGWIIELNPIAIMRGYVDDLKEKRGVMAENIRLLSGQVQTLTNKINEKKGAAEKALKMAAVARDQGNAAQMRVQSNQHGRLSNYTVQLEDVLTKSQFLLKMLRKYYEATGAVIEDLQNEVDIQEDQRKTIFAAYNAMTASREILAGQGDKWEMFNDAMTLVKDQYGMKLGEIDDFMETSKSFIEGMDLENGVFQEDALKKIAEWESKVDSVILGDGKRQAIEQAHTTATMPSFNNLTVGDAQNEYAKLFGKK